MSAARKPLRFVLVGLVNTAIDFLLLFGLRAVGLPVVPANMISTGAALAFSFFANRSFTFRADRSDPGPGRTARQAVMFLLVTLIGLWVLQPLVLLAGGALLSGVLDDTAALLTAKIAATAVSMVWNYLLYDRVVFRSRRSEARTLREPETTADPEQ